MGAMLQMMQEMMGKGEKPGQKTGKALLADRAVGFVNLAAHVGGH